MHVRIRVWWVGLALLVTSMSIVGCTSTGQFDLFGYTTAPNYDPSIKTVYVPMAQNTSMRRGLEYTLTQAVIREIGWKTSMRVTSDRASADTELLLKIATWRKNLIIATPTNQVRQAETGLGIEVVWKDLRPDHFGDILSNRKSNVPKEAPLPGEAPPAKLPPVPVLILPVASYETELGGSNAAAEQQAIDRAAVQIISMMERPY